MFPGSLSPCALISILLSVGLANAAVQVAVPATPSATNVVQSNFLGISYELSFITDYFGNDTEHMSTPMLNYLAGIRARTGANPVRVRIGGNSADISPYDSQPASPMVALLPGNFSFDDQPATYNAMLWSVMADVATSVGGVAYVINIPLAIPPNASMSTDIRNTLGGSLDAMLLGNEPDLYSRHGKRPNLKNYTEEDYFGDYTAAIKIIGAGDSAGVPDIGGPSLCCFWDLATLLETGYLTQFGAVLKYISVQHYPQNDCTGTFRFQLPWYMQHSNVVTLAQWQKPGIDYLLSQPAANRPELIISEFNSASCGGVPFSPAFGVGSLWSIDYALQLASVGYSQAYIHTREAGISYNLVAPPAGPPGTAGAWTTNAPYYALLGMAEALRTDHGAIVQDLNLGGSMSDATATTSGYAVYDADNKTVSRLVLFNWANASTEFAVPASVFAPGGTALVKFLAAATPGEESAISWGGETWGPGVGDGKSALSPAWVVPNQNLSGCAQSGCTFTAPGPSLAMVFLDDAQFDTIASAGANATASSGGGSSGGGSGGSTPSAGGVSGAAVVRVARAAAFGAFVCLGFVLCNP